MLFFFLDHLILGGGRQSYLKAHHRPCVVGGSVIAVSLTVKRRAAPSAATLLDATRLPFVRLLQTEFAVMHPRRAKIDQVWLASLLLPGGRIFGTRAASAMAAARFPDNKFPYFIRAAGGEQAVLAKGVGVVVPRAVLDPGPSFRGGGGAPCEAGPSCGALCKLNTNQPGQRPGEWLHEIFIGRPPLALALASLLHFKI